MKSANEVHSSVCSLNFILLKRIAIMFRPWAYMCIYVCLSGAIIQCVKIHLCNQQPSIESACRPLLIRINLRFFTIFFHKRKSNKMSSQFQKKIPTNSEAAIAQSNPKRIDHRHWSPIKYSFSRSLSIMRCSEIGYKMCAISRRRTDRSTV